VSFALREQSSWLHDYRWMNTYIITKIHADYTNAKLYK
jgi:hypothetical protein